MRLLVWFYYRRIKVFGAENLPKDGAVIIISNHQNALLDPVISCVLLRRQIHWLTRADVFRNPVANKILRSLNMMPVYRAHDKADLRTANDPTFQECTVLLKNGNVIGLFPEGTHHGGKYLKPLKKGLARIALNSLQELPDTKICMVPVGLDYENSFHSGFDLCLSVGKPIDLSDFRTQIPGENAALQKFTNLADSCLSAEMIDLRNPEIADHFKVLEDILADVYDETKGENKGAYSAFRSLRTTVFSPLQNQDAELWKKTADEWVVFQTKYNFKYQRGAMNGNSSIIGFLMEMVYFFFMPWHITFYPLRLVTRWIVSLLIKDIHFTSSIKILVAPLISTIGILCMMTLVFMATCSLTTMGIYAVLSLFYLIIWPDLERNMRQSKARRILNGLKNNEKSLEKWLIIREQISNLLGKTQ